MVKIRKLSKVWKTNMQRRRNVKFFGCMKNSFSSRTQFKISNMKNIRWTLSSCNASWSHIKVVISNMKDMVKSNIKEDILVTYNMIKLNHENNGHLCPAKYWRSNQDGSGAKCLWNHYTLLVIQNQARWNERF